MNKIIVEITNCQNCKYCSHNGLLQTTPKYVCHHIDVRGRNKVNTKYWYDMPVLALVNEKNGENISIPDWCPRLRKVDDNER